MYGHTSFESKIVNQLYVNEEKGRLVETVCERLCYVRKECRSRWSFKSTVGSISRVVLYICQVLNHSMEIQASYARGQKYQRTVYFYACWKMWSLHGECMYSMVTIHKAILQEALCEGTGFLPPSVNGTKHTLLLPSVYPLLVWTGLVYCVSCSAVYFAVSGLGQPSKAANIEQEKTTRHRQRY